MTKEERYLDALHHIVHWIATHPVDLSGDPNDALEEYAELIDKVVDIAGWAYIPEKT